MAKRSFVAQATTQPVDATLVAASKQEAAPAATPSVPLTVQCPKSALAGDKVGSVLNIGAKSTGSFMIGFWKGLTK